MSVVTPPVFKLERYFAKHEFSCKHILCGSDAESFPMKELLNMADKECMDLWDSLGLGYTTSEGHPLLRKEVTKFYPGLEADDVLIIAPQEGIYIAMKCLVALETRGGKSMHAVATFPAYQSLYQNLQTAGCDVSLWTSKYTDKGWTFDMNDLKQLIKEDTKVLVVNFPHNPTGFFPTEAHWQEIVDLCKERDIFLFSDEMYRMSNNDGSLPLPSACTLYEKAITLSGLSKTFALPGLRIGWLCTKNAEIMAEMASFKDYITICSSAPSEILSIIAVKNSDKLIAKTLSVIVPNLAILNEFLAQHKDIFEWHPPSACTVGFLRVKGWLLELGKGGASGFCEVLLEEAGVLLLPAAMYDFTDEFVRIAFGRKNMPQAVAALAEFLQTHKPK